MTKLKSLTALAVALLLTASLLAHQITYKGTVMASRVEAGKLQLKVSVIDEKTKKPVPMDFTVDKDTKILRGDKLVTIAEARIEKNEKIAVTIDHDTDETIVVRLDPKK